MRHPLDANATRDLLSGSVPKGASIQGREALPREVADARHLLELHFGDVAYSGFCSRGKRGVKQKHGVRQGRISS